MNRDYFWLMGESLRRISPTLTKNLMTPAENSDRSPGEVCITHYPQTILVSCGSPGDSRRQRKVYKMDTGTILRLLCSRAEFYAVGKTSGQIKRRQVVRLP
jgi:hypothetical protein